MKNINKVYEIKLKSSIWVSDIYKDVVLLTDGKNTWEVNINFFEENFISL